MKNTIKAFLLSLVALFSVNFTTLAQDAVVVEEVEATEVVAEVAAVAEAPVAEVEAVEEDIHLGETFISFYKGMGLYKFFDFDNGGWKYLIMLCVALLLNNLSLFCFCLLHLVCCLPTCRAQVCSMKSSSREVMFTGKNLPMAPVCLTTFIWVLSWVFILA